MSKKRRNITISKTSLLLTTVILSLCAISANAQTHTQMRNLTTQQLVRDMGLGINLGNTLEATGSWITGGTVNAYETAWGSPTITRPMIAGYKNSGFKTVRVPVAWSNLMTGDALANNQTGGSYTISPALMDRVQEIVDWILDEDMYVILNIHWDGGWWSKFSTDSTEAMRKFQRIWTQIGQRFQGYGDRLIFASLNEEGGWNDIWYIWDNGNDLVAKQRSYTLLNVINQAFVRLIRAQGGNNPNRHLQIQGYHTDIDRTVDPMFVVPTDPRSGGARVAVSVHYYDPFGFTHLDKDEDWAPMTLTWGTQQEINHLNSQMDKLVTRFVNNNVPVIIGEYGLAVQGRSTEQVRNYTLAVTRAIYNRNMLPVLWCVQLDASRETILYYNRRSNPPAFPDQQMVAGFIEIAPPQTSSVRDNIVNTKPAITRPAITLKGKTLNVSSFGDTDVRVRMIDVKGKVRATFTAKGGNGSFSVDKMPAGRYLIEVKGVDVKKTVSAVVLM